jgi:hypothetical protein
LSRHLVGAPDDVAQLLFPGDFIEKAQTVRPDAIEDDPACGRLDYFDFRISVNGLFAKIRIFYLYFLLDFDRLFC